MRHHHPVFSLLAPIIGLISTVVIHLAAWRTMRPRSPARLLPFAALLGGAAGAWAAGTWFPGPAPAEMAAALLLFGTVVASYLISVPALESESPSSLIVTCVDKRAAGGGVSRDDLAAVVNDETFVLNRARGLEVDGLVERADGRLRITARGRKFLQGFLFYHHLVGRRGLAG